METTFHLGLSHKMVCYTLTIVNIELPTQREMLACATSGDEAVRLRPSGMMTRCCGSGRRCERAGGCCAEWPSEGPPGYQGAPLKRTSVVTTSRES